MPLQKSNAFKKKSSLFVYVSSVICTGLSIIIIVSKIKTKECCKYFWREKRRKENLFSNKNQTKKEEKKL